MKNKTKNLPITIVVTVFNESQSIQSLLNSLKSQSLQPDKVIVVDGGSTDGTLKLLRGFKWSKLEVITKVGNRSVGRNHGISRSQSGIIAITDAGCIPHKDWLKNLVIPFESAKVQVVSGYYAGLARTNFQRSLIPFVLVMPDQAEKSEFFPSTRSMALRKSVWENIAKFDESLFHNEDYAYAHSLKKHGIKFHFSKSALVSWIPRRNLSESAWMFCRFAIGDIQSGIFRPKVKALLARYLIFIYLFFLSFYYPFITPWLIAAIFAYILLSIIKNYRYVRHISAIFWLPIIQVTADLSVIFGTIVGFLSKAYGIF